MNAIHNFFFPCKIKDALISSSSYDSSSDFALKHLLLFEICARAICEKFVYKHSETVKFVKN